MSRLLFRGCLLHRKNKKSSIFIPLIFLLSGMIIFLSCEVKSPITGNDTAPVVRQTDAPETVYLDSGEPAVMRAVVWDPQGYKDIEQVVFNVYAAGGAEPVASGNLSDAGEKIHGDIVPGDGLYACVLEPSVFGGEAGTYYIQVYAADYAGNESGTVSDTLTAEPGMGATAPEVMFVSLPDTVEFSQADSVLCAAGVTDMQGIADVCSVFCAVYAPRQADPSYTFMLNNNGENGDSLAADSLFSLYLDMSSHLAGPGIYSVRVQALDTDGLMSWPATGSFYLEMDNTPPVLSGLSAPDTVSRATEVPFILSVAVDDSQGPGDIDKVWFSVVRPDGTSAGTNFEMNDSGEDGDETAEDGIYSLSVRITSANDTGAYTFTFRARDRSMAESDPLIHIITVTE